MWEKWQRDPTAGDEEWDLVRDFSAPRSYLLSTGLAASKNTAAFIMRGFGLNRIRR